jgi:hypothetical protein
MSPLFFCIMRDMIDPASCLSAELGPMGPRVEALVRAHRTIWEATSPKPEPLPLSKRFSAREKRAAERELSGIVERLTAHDDPTRQPTTFPPAEDPGRLEGIIAALRPSGQRLLELIELPLGSVYDERFVDSTRRFLKAARDFDPALGLDAVYQALRNVWIMNTLQFEMGLDVEHTEAVFGYSMVYPYLDNFIDDDTAPSSEKLATLARLKAWLEGKPQEPKSPREEKLRSLIGLVESRFSRAEHPGVFHSMLAIYNAQIRSLLQQRRAGPVSDRDTRGDTLGDILGISLEKGGTSVLADGYLVAGRLDRAQEDFCFGFGAFLQLIDDLQDIEEDARRRHMTLFSQGSGRDALDPLLYKFLRFMAAVLERPDGSRRTEAALLRAIILRACSLMALESAGKHRGRFSGKCLRLCQGSFPVRFSYLRKLRRKLDDRIVKGRPTIADTDPVLTAFLAASSRAFALD